MILHEILIVGVEADIISSPNSLNMLLENSNEDDFVVSKLGESAQVKVVEEECFVVVSSLFHPSSLIMASQNSLVLHADIDTSSIEVPMVDLLLDNEHFDKLVDCFYFEHHVHLRGLANS